MPNSRDWEQAGYHLDIGRLREHVQRDQRFDPETPLQDRFHIPRLGGWIAGHVHDLPQCAMPQKLHDPAP